MDVRRTVPHPWSGKLVPKTCEWCCVLSTFFTQSLEISPRKTLVDVALCPVCNDIIRWYSDRDEISVQRGILRRIEEKEYQ